MKTQPYKYMTLLFLLACSSNDKGDSSTSLSSDFVLGDSTETGPGFHHFDRVVEFWGLRVFGESGVSDEKLRYVAAVWAELIDNDEDGLADDSALLERLVDRQAMMPVFLREGSNAEQTLFDNYEGEGIGAVLYNNEVDPSQPGHWGADASIEELMHTINHVGHVYLYPDVFGLQPNSSRLTEAMDIARGGQFTSVPQSYPEDAWYHYDDVTCDYECMAIEYIYWAQVSAMGILNDPDTCSGIANEWELCSPELLEDGDPLVYAIVSDSANKLPRLPPDGVYSPSSLSE